MVLRENGRVPFVRDMQENFFCGGLPRGADGIVGRIFSLLSEEWAVFGVVYSLYLVIYVHEGFATSKLALGCRVPLVDISLFLFKSMTTIWDLYYFGICILNMGNIFASLSLALLF